MFGLLFTYVPDAEIRWRDVWLGGLITAVLFTLGKTAIGYYLGQASVGSAYGAAAPPVPLGALLRALSTLLAAGFLREAE